MASMLLRQHGDRAPAVVTERIGQLAAEGQAEGVALWKEVAWRLDQLCSRTQFSERISPSLLSRAYPSGTIDEGQLLIRLSY